MAQTYVGVTPPQVGSADNGTPVVTGQSQRLSAASSASGVNLARTGADIAQLVLIGGSAIAAGTIVVRSTRRRTI